MSRFQERLYRDASLTLEIAKVIYQGRSDYQEIEIFENPIFGRVLALDGVIQTTERDEFIYHEMLAHVPMFSHGSARDILIIGGGDGGLLEEVLKHPVASVVMVDIDEMVMRIAREHMPTICGGAFADRRAEVIAGDGCRYMADSDRSFDVILVDSTDPSGPGIALFERPFYTDCKRRLRPGGILATQNGVPFLQGGEISDTFGRLEGLFADRSFFLAPVPTYVGGTIALGWASDSDRARTTPADVLERRYAAAGFPTRFYSPAVHRAAFALPPYVRALMR